MRPPRNQKGLLKLLILLLRKKIELLHRMPKQICRNSNLTGHAFVMKVLNGADDICYELFRMRKDVFISLCSRLKSLHLLEDSRYVSVQEKVAIFVLTVGHIHRNRVLQDRFQYSGETISQHFNDTLIALAKLSMDLIKPHTPLTEIPSHIRTNPEYYPFFKDCVGAIDGTHVNACVPSNLKIRYRGRKSMCTQNVMAACDFDMCFTFVNAGWEGTATDLRILLHCVHNKGLNFPQAPKGKYYMVDTGYPNMVGFLAPYKETRYHLPDFQRGERVAGRKEMYNDAHSSLRNVFERTFGVLKARFPILRSMPSFSLQSQMFVVVACMAIHNFVRLAMDSDHLFDLYDSENYFDYAEEEDATNECISDGVGGVDNREVHIMHEERERIADMIWNAHRH